MNDRRLQLPKVGGKTVKWFQIAERAGITVTTLNALRKGQNVPTEDTKRGVENALEWAHGSIDSILSGGQAKTIGQEHMAGSGRVDASTRVKVEATMKLLDEAHRRIDNASPDQVKAFVDMLRATHVGNDSEEPARDSAS